MIFERCNVFHTRSALPKILEIFRNNCNTMKKVSEEESTKRQSIFFKVVVQRQVYFLHNIFSKDFVIP